jgi:6-phosphogluconate dehydrogenase (decarboxylating)
MKAVFFIQKEKQGQAKGKVYGDELVSKQTIILRDSSALGMKKDGYYLMIDGEDDAVKKAKEILKDSAKELTGPEAEEVIAAIDKQESSAAEGFGAIFG